jgi:hypothetical protein
VALGFACSIFDRAFAFSEPPLYSVLPRAHMNARRSDAPLHLAT